MNDSPSPFPEIYKGIALFTPGGDLVYTIDPHKQERWHLHLCLSLQETLGLIEPPHFLVPGYTATIDRWRDRKTGKIEVFAEFYPAVQRYIPFLQVLFDCSQWHVADWQEEYCNPNLLETYKTDFPELWQENELIVHLDSHKWNRTDSQQGYGLPSVASLDRNKAISRSKGYVLRLFVSRDNESIEQTLSSIHKILEQGLSQPYTLKIVDISKNPEQAERDRISATPALVRVFPEPVKKIIGELDDLEKVLKIITS